MTDTRWHKPSGVLTSNKNHHPIKSTHYPKQHPHEEGWASK